MPHRADLLLAGESEFTAAGWQPRVLNAKHVPTLGKVLQEPAPALTLAELHSEEQELVLSVLLQDTLIAKWRGKCRMGRPSVSKASCKPEKF